MKKLLPLFAALCLATSTFAQTYSIKGSLIDAEKAPLSFTTVLLLSPSDSSMITFVRADTDGNFIFKNLKRQDYLLKATFVGFVPLQDLIKFDPAVLQKDLGQLILKPIQKELFEVVVRTAKAPMSFKGDTIEYDASKFKVPPGSSVEDLLRKLPGVQIDAEGNIKAQGEEVKRVTVDGKRFFGDDPKLATKNLPAEAINKVQVFNDKSESAKLTGVEDGKREKTVNLELKEEFKKGGFGKATAGAGSDQRVMGKANYNKFDTKNQFAVVGFGNNINQTGLSNNDYQDFKGSQSYNWNDNADFGFSQGGMRFFSFGGDDDNDDNLEIPQTWGPGQGFSKNYAGGMNYNYDTKKTKVSSNYFFNQTDQTLDQLTNSQYFLPTSNYFRADSSFNRNYSQNHRMSVRLEKELDSLNTFVLNVNGRVGNRTQSSVNGIDFLNTSNERFRNQASSNVFDATSFILSSSAIYRHKFMKKGRNFAISGTYNKNNSDQNANQTAIFNEYSVVGEKFPFGSNIRNLNQNVLGLSGSNEIKSSLLFMEPLSKKVVLETFYNFSNLGQKVDRDVFDLFADSEPRVDSLSRYFENNILFNRVGTALRFNAKGLNISGGIAAQQFDIRGKFYNNQGQSEIGIIKNTYRALLPNVSVNYDLKNSRYLNFDYNVGLNAPRIRDLQPFIDNSNPMFVRKGNPNLLPTTTYNSNLYYYVFNPVSFINLNAGVSYTRYKNQVILNQQVNNDLSTVYTPENISGGDNFNVYTYFGFPIKKTKVAMALNASTGISKNLMYINNVLNENKGENFYLGTRLDLTPIDWFSWFISANAGINNASYSISTNQNQRFFNNSVQSNMVLQLPKLIFFTTDFNYTHFKNNKLGFNQHVPILNLSTYKVVGKNKKSEIRLSLYDAFKRNLRVNQNAFQNVISSSISQTLSRYFMVTYTYNMKGITAKVKKSRWED
jgi:hypothetical protein